MTETPEPSRRPASSRARLRKLGEIGEKVAISLAGRALYELLRHWAGNLP